MASIASPARPALGDLAVNSVCTPIKAMSLVKDPASRKRHIDEVQEPACAPAQKRVLSPSKCANAYATNEHTTPPVIPLSPSATPFELNEPSTLDMTEENPSPRSIPSSVADYDLDDTIESQQTAATEVTQSLASMLPPHLPYQQDHQSSVSHHLELLRLRLRLAQFKVQTNQTTIPFSQLRVTMSCPPSSATNQPSATSYHSASQIPTHQRSEIATDPSIPHFRLNRSTTTTQTSSVRGTLYPSQDSSSSPSRRSLSPENDANAFRTPALPRQRLLEVGSGNGRDEMSRDEEGLTSSVIKGNAAMGLLGLRAER